MRLLSPLEPLQGHPVLLPRLWMDSQETNCFPFRRSSILLALAPAVEIVGTHSFAGERAENKCRRVGVERVPSPLSITFLTQLSVAFTPELLAGLCVATKSVEMWRIQPSKQCDSQRAPCVTKDCHHRVDITKTSKKEETENY